MQTQFKNVLALFGAVMLLSGVLAWTLHVPEGPTTNSVIYAVDRNNLKDLAPGTAGQALITNGSGSAPSWGNVALATGTGTRIAGVTVVLDGSNPTPAVTGLTTIDACALTNVRSATPGDEVTTLTYVATGGTANVYAWTTSGTDPTLLGSGDANDVIAVLCTGT